MRSLHKVLMGVLILFAAGCGREPGLNPKQPIPVGGVIYSDSLDQQVVDADGRALDLHSEQVYTYMGRQENILVVNRTHSRRWQGTRKEETEETDRMLLPLDRKDETVLKIADLSNPYVSARSFLVNVVDDSNRITVQPEDGQAGKRMVGGGRAP